jgi:hypothetical protein
MLVHLDRRQRANAGTMKRPSPEAFPASARCPCHAHFGFASTRLAQPMGRQHVRVPKTCATWAKAMQSAVERSACGGPVLTCACR